MLKLPVIPGLTSLVLVAALTTPAGAQSVADQVRGAVARYVDAINSGPPGAVAALYLEGPSTTSIGDGQITYGWRPIAELLRDVYAQVGEIRMTAESLAVTPLGETAVLAVFRYRWVLGRTNPQAVTGAMTLVFMRTPAGWRVVHDHTSTLLGGGQGPATSPVTDSGPPGPVRATTACTVTRIVDGDTVECARLGRVRLIGMDTPEMNQASFGVQAAEALAVLIPVGAMVDLERDVELHDRYGRLLSYVWRGGTLVNWVMVRNGWAVTLTYPPNVQYVEWFADAQQRAQGEGRGLWAAGGFDCAPVDRRRGRCD